MKATKGRKDPTDGWGHGSCNLSYCGRLRARGSWFKASPGKTGRPHLKNRLGLMDCNGILSYEGGIVGDLLLGTAPGKNRDPVGISNKAGDGARMAKTA